MKLLRFWLVFPLALLLGGPAARAWSAPGHQLIAAEAYRHLPQTERALVFSVLEAHPDFHKWTNAYRPNPAYGLAAYVFMRASTWPDEIRDTDSPYSHPDWHFIDYPLRPPDFPMESPPQPDNDLLYGIARCERTLADPHAAAVLRAVYLSYLVHLVGDIHQPLHCESFYGSGYVHGDRGGNDFYVRNENGAVKLHAIWDHLLGFIPSPRRQWRYAIRLDRKFPKSSLPELAGDKTPRSWSLKSRHLAITRGYLNGLLKGSRWAASAPPLPPGYLKAAKVVAERQAALAGYRLAAQIEKYVKPAGPVPPLPPRVSLTASAPLVPVIGAAAAAQYDQQSVIVTGRVVQVSVESRVTFLNLDRRYPRTPLAAVVFKDEAGQFGNLRRLTS